MSIPEKYGSAFYRSLLSNQAQFFYDCINTQLFQGDYSGKTIVPINEPGASKDGFAAYKAVRDDHPEYFFLGFEYKFVQRYQTGIISYRILYSENQINRIRHQMRRSIYHTVCGTAHLSLIERESLVYERIARKLTYSNHGDVRDHNIVGPVLTSGGVCEGQNAFLLLCFRRVGIPCIKIYGKTRENVSHCWTIAWINGKPVHCDVTGDCDSKNVVWFEYFNLSDNQIARDHFDFKRTEIPACVSEEANYYRYNGYCVCSFWDLRRFICDALKNGKSLIQIHYDYRPKSGDYLRETQKALSLQVKKGNYQVYYNTYSNNLVIRRI